MKLYEGNQDVLAEVRSIKHVFEYLTLLFTDGVTGKSRRMIREEFSPLLSYEK
ncbi:MAG: hypothetical protein AB7V50_04095 [Vampirovibrionia bacterium]